MASMRIDRISEEMKKALSEILLHDIKDPRMSSFVSVLRVDLSGDLSYAKIHLSILGDTQIKKDTIEALKSARGYITRELGKKIKIRKLPQLIFIEDTSIEYAIHMEKMLNSIKPESKPESNDAENDIE